jgi:NAD(P)-dependent dehydrogenase (short-subunit alcohol dehydrogenase family)
MMDKLVIVTGASRGIGAAIAYRLAEQGYAVGCVSRSGSLPQVQDADAGVMARCIACAADVTDEAALRKAIGDLAGRGIPLAGLVNNAGFHADHRSATMPIAEWRAIMAANADAVVIGCQAVYPFFKESGGGLIINIGSYYDKLGVKKNLAYCASKAAVGAITRVLAVEWARDGISVINVAPGFVLTDLNRAEWDKPGGPLRPHIEKRVPGGRPGKPDDIAALAVNLFGMSTSFLTGETIYIDGAQALVA